MTWVGGSWKRGGKGKADVWKEARRTRGQQTGKDSSGKAERCWKCEMVGRVWGIAEKICDHMQKRTKLEGSGRQKCMEEGNDQDWLEERLRVRVAWDSIDGKE